MAGAAPHVMVLPFPAQGHVTPLMELSHRLVDHGFQVTFVNTDVDHALVLAALPNGGEALREALSELLGPVGLPLLPLGLVLVIRVLSSGLRLVAVFGFAVGESLDAAYRSGRGSPVGVVLALMFFLLAVYYRSWSPFGGDDA